jgi:hypothetical protein
MQTEVYKLPIMHSFYAEKIKKLGSNSALQDVHKLFITYKQSSRRGFSHVIQDK